MPQLCTCVSSCSLQSLRRTEELYKLWWYYICPGFACQFKWWPCTVPESMNSTLPGDVHYNQHLWCRLETFFFKNKKIVYSSRMLCHASTSTAEPKTLRLETYVTLETVCKCWVFFCCELWIENLQKSNAEYGLCDSSSITIYKRIISTCTSFKSPEEPSRGLSDERAAGRIQRIIVPI